MSRSTPTLRRRYLSAELKRLRIAAGVSAARAAEALGCSTDKIHWIERADWNRPKWRDVRDLLDAYGVTGVKREELVALAQESGGAEWWQPYGGALSKKFTAFVGMEADADSVRTFEPCVLPGLLRTEDYARAAVDAARPPDADERVAVLMERQRAFFEDGSKRLCALVDEAALRRPVGGPGVMRAQIEHLIALAGDPALTLLLVPFSAGPLPSTGSFTLLAFGGQSPAAVYAETVAGDVLVEDAGEVDAHTRVFDRLTAMALTPEETVEVLTGL